MTRKRFILRMLALLGLVPSVLILTMAMLTFVQAEGSAASIEVVKTADPTVVNVGSTVDYTISVENTGDSDLTDVTVDDDLSGCILVGPSGDNGNLVLEPDETWTFNCSVTASSEDIVNTATVTATDELSETVSGSAQATVDVIHPAMDIEKRADPMAARVGDTVNYTITVDNDGDSDLTNVGVDDDLAGCTLTGPSGDNGNLVLETYETWIYVCSVTAGSEDIVNTAIVTATDEAGGTVTDWAQAEVDVIHPDIKIAKMPDTQMVASGSAVNFTIAVTNTGDVTLRDVTVSDARVRDCDGTFARLWASEHRSYSCEVVNVTEGFINSATVTGTAQQVGQDVIDADAAKVRLDETLTCPADLLGYWKLDESDGATTYDDFYYGHYGECAGRCPTPAAGQVGGGQAFNGSNAGIEVLAVPGDDSFDWGVNDSFSIEFWMKTESGSPCAGNQVVVGRVNSAAWWVGCQDGGRAAFYLEDTGGTNALVDGTIVTDGAWHHIVAVRDAGTHEIRIYVDGNLGASKPVTYGASFDSPMMVLSIGWLDRTTGYHFEGIVDEVGVYNRALSADEVRQHHNEGRVGRGYCESGSYAPTIVSAPVTEATVGRTYSYDVEAVGDPAPTYALLTYPDGMAIDQLTGLISWEPALGQEGSQAVVVEASNSLGTHTQSFGIEVSEGTICPADMITYWRLDEDGGPIYDDFYYNGHDGVCIAAGCPAPVAGLINGGQEFNGIDTGIDVPAHTTFDWGVNDSFTIEFWVRTDSGSTCAGNEVVVGRADSAAWWVGCQDGGETAFYLVDTAGRKKQVTGSMVTDGTWHHVVAVRDASAHGIYIYVDGQEDAMAGTEYVGGFGSTAALNIGWLERSGGYHFDGILDEVALYDRALSSGEIEQHYNEGDPGPGYCINPDIVVEKTANPAVVYPGDWVTYTYTVTSPGDTPLSVVVGSDDKCSPVTFVGGDSDGDNLLDLIETWVYTCSMALSADITNTVTFTGHHSLGGTVSNMDVVFVDVREQRQIFLPAILRD